VTIETASRPSYTNHSNVLNLTNLLMRETPHRVTTIQLGSIERDPELYVVTRVDWRESSQPILSQLPRLLSCLEVLRGTEGVPAEVYLENTEGLVIYIRMDIRVSDIPEDPRDVVTFLRDRIDSTLEFYYTTVEEVERQFWSNARRKGFSPAIAEKMARKEKGFRSRTPIAGFHMLLRAYFSLRFRIHSSESCLRVEG